MYRLEMKWTKKKLLSKAFYISTWIYREKKHLAGSLIRGKWKRFALSVFVLSAWLATKDCKDPRTETYLFILAQFTLPSSLQFPPSLLSSWSTRMLDSMLDSRLLPSSMVYLFIENCETFAESKRLFAVSFLGVQ